MAGFLRNLVFISVFFCVAPLMAQRFYVDSYQHSADFKGKVNDIASDSAGFIWLATDEGLYRFDDINPTLIEKGRYAVLFKTSSGRLLIGGDYGIRELQYSKHQPQLADFLDPFGEQEVQNFQMAQTDDEEFWITIPDGVVRFNDKRSEKYGVDGFEGIYTDLLIVPHKNGNLWLMSHTGDIYYFDVRQNRFTRQKYDAFRAISSASLLDDSHLLMYTDAGLRLARIDSLGHLLSDQPIEGAPDDVSMIKVTSEGGVLLGTEADGIYFGLYGDGRINFSKIFNSNDPHRIQSLPFEKVTSLFVSSPQEIWVGHERGITLLRELTFANISLMLPHATVGGLAPVSGDETYVSIEGILYRITGRRHPYSIENVELDLAPYRPGVMQSVGNRLWITSTAYQLFYLENGRKSRVLDFSDRGTAIFVIRSDDEGNIWGAQAPSHKPLTGLLKITPDLEVIEYDESDGFESRMLIAEQAPYGILYAAGIGEDSYLYRYDADKDRFVNISVPMNFDYGDNFEVHDIGIGNDSTIWLASTAGMLRYKNGEIEKIVVKGMEDNEAVAAEVTDDGAVWFSMDSKGLIRYKDGKHVVYNQKMGLPADFMIYRNLVVDDKGKIWVGTREGLCTSLKPTPQPLQVMKPQFVNLKVNGKAYIPKRDENYFESGAGITASFISLTYPLHKNLYYYRILGLADSTWRSIDDSLALDNLNAGEYTLEVKANQIAGYLESEPLKFQFAIGKVWYATWWGISLLVFGGFCGLTGVFYTGYMVRMKSIRKQQEELRKLVDERTTELKRSNTELEYQKRELRKSAEVLKQRNNELDQFAYIVSHDLKAPLRAINHLSVWIEEDLADKTHGDIQKNMNLLRGRVFRMENLIDGILSYARVGKVEAKSEEVDLDKLVVEVIEILEVPKKFTVSVKRKLPVVCINGTLMEQIFSNLISNAVKYHDKPVGTITIDYQEDENYHTFSVTDNGPGIPKEFQEKAFAIFQTLEPKDSRESTGVGLAIVKKIITEYHGKIWIESERGKGTTFWFTIPKCQPDEKESGRTD
ncbi:hypothetical protein C900_04758 [Fulvivirga imtechensis AK7]|uniref:histidine kinase n=2 Tax=Fulvivirga TaxID=396811 RepID=L8K1E0_9BACT|nr:hypothetical protein C900_04758 [Fulvivirga imtechensis AK7]